MNTLSISHKVSVRRCPNISNKCNTFGKLIEKSKFPSSIFKTRENLKSLDEFTFQSVTKVKVRKEILNSDESKATQCGDIPAKILKESIDISLVELTNIINLSSQNGFFSEELKMAEVFPVF